VAPSSPLLALPGMPGEMERVEVALRAVVRAGDDVLTRMASHLGLAGGKRWRPALTVASATCAVPVPRVSEDVVRGAAAVELVHQGSLYHDDVIDEADTRHGVESANARWGNLAAILAGDFLLAKASEIAATLGSEVAGLLASTICRLCEGEVRELGTAYDRARTEGQYLTAISGKTASLFAAACRIGALVAHRPRPAVEALTGFGRSYGMAFQIVDDVLDVVGSEADLGKPTGNDLATGVYTLPVIRALASPVEGPELADLLGQPLDRGDVERARKLVRSQAAVDDALAVARHHAEDAVTALAPLRPTLAVDHLAAAALALLEAVPAGA
jgi:heptaprenyl diphosphate synthase